MSRKKIFMVFIVFSFFCVHKCIVSAQESTDLFQEIRSLTSAEFVEWGEKISFISSSDKLSEDTVLAALEAECTEFSVNKTGEEQLNHTIFEAENMSGFITLNNEKTTLEVIERTNKYELKGLEHSLLNTIDGNKYEICRYAKIKTKNQDVETIKDDIIIFLTRIKSENITVTPLEQGYSITALTGCYESIWSGNAKIDFNVAICSYDSGTYVIMGTPLIMKDY